MLRGQREPQKILEQRKGRAETMPEEWSAGPSGSDSGAGRGDRDTGSLAEGQEALTEGRRKCEGDGREAEGQGPINSGPAACGALSGERSATRDGGLWAQLTEEWEHHRLKGNSRDQLFC